MTEEFSYDRATVPYHPDCYQWPRIGVFTTNKATDELQTAQLNVHCLRDMNASSSPSWASSAWIAKSRSAR